MTQFDLPQNRLPREKETELSLRIQADKTDLDAVHILVLHNLQEALYYTKKCSNQAIPDADLLSLCYDTLLRNAKRFKSEFGTRFFAFCKPGLRGSLTRYWKGLDVVRNASAKRTDEIIGGPTFVPFTGGTDYVSRSIAGGRLPIPMEDEVVDNHPHDDEFKDNITCTQGGVVEADFDTIHRRELWSQVEPSIALLSDRQKMVLRLSYQSGFNFQEIGNLLGISRSAVQTVHAKALDTIRGDLTRRGRLFN